MTSAQEAPVPKQVQVKVLMVGECLLELRHVSETELSLGYAGDTFNTAVYFQRTAQDLSVDAAVGYLTGLGEDPYSQRMRRMWAEHAVLDRSITVPDRQPGIYTISTDDSGERSFSYWRSASAAKALFEGDDWIASVDADLVHFSGITLQLMTPPVRVAFLGRLAALRADGAQVSFDTNYRPTLWPNPDAARLVFDQAARWSDVVLATLDDEALLCPGIDADEVANRYLALGAREVVVKLGAAGALVCTEDDARTLVPALPVSRVVDTTAAGDSFAGAYLAARLAHRFPSAAAALAATLASQVISATGAITPTLPVRVQ